MNANEPLSTVGTAVLATRMQRGELFAAECPSRGVLPHLTSRWGVLVPLVASTQRLSDLRGKIGGVSEEMLEVAHQVEGLAAWNEDDLPRILRVRRERAGALASAGPRAGVRHGVSTSA